MVMFVWGHKNRDASLYRYSRGPQSVDLERVVGHKLDALDVVGVKTAKAEAGAETKKAENIQINKYDLSKVITGTPRSRREGEDTSTNGSCANSWGLESAGFQPWTWGEPKV